MMMETKKEISLNLKEKIEEMSLGHLITTSARVILAKYEVAQNTLGISPPRSGILILLNDLGEISQSQICEYLFLEKTNISVLLREMEKDDLVTIRKDPKDKRINLVQLKTLGKRLIPKLKEINEDISISLAKTMPKNDKRILTKFFQDLLISQLKS